MFNTRFLLRIGLYAVISMAGINTIAAQPLAVDNLTQIISKDSATSKTVSWQSSVPHYNYCVEYRQQGSNDIHQAYVTEPKRPPIYDYDNIPPYTYGAYMQHLQPDMAYEYRICNDEDEETGWFSFTTTKEELNQYKVLIFGDSQSVDYSVWGQTAQIAWNQNKDTAFFVNMGDLTDNGQAWFQWRDWQYNADILTSHLPFAPVLGNHEAYSMEWKFAYPYTYKALFAVPYGSPQGQSRLTYSFDYGDVHYVSLNTDYEELHAQDPDMLTNEAAWLDADLAAAKKAGKRLIVMMHRPPWDSPYHGVLDSNGKCFMPIFDKYDVPLVFTAHDHCYERTVPVKNDTQAETGTIYIATGRSGTESWDAARRKPTDVVYYNPMDMPMYLTLQVEPKDFRVTAFKNDGTIIDTTTIATNAVLPKPQQTEKQQPKAIKKVKKSARTAKK